MGQLMVCNESALQQAETRIGMVSAGMDLPILLQHFVCTLSTLFPSLQSGRDVQAIVKMSQKNGFNQAVAADVLLGFPKSLNRSGLSPLDAFPGKGFPLPLGPAFGPNFLINPGF